MAVRVLTLFESGPTAAAAAATRLLAALPAGRVDVTSVDLHPTPDNGTATRRVPFRYALDLLCLRDLRRIAASSRPDVVHAFGPLAVRASAVIRPRRLVVSHADRVRDPFTRWLVRSADHVFVHTAAARGRCERAGVKRNRIVDVPVAANPPDPATRNAVRDEFGLSEEIKLIVASGQFDPNAGLRFAVWAFDIVRHVHPGARLMLIGDGPQRPRLARFAESLGCRSLVTFTGRRTDSPRIIAAADCVWLTHREGGATVGYEALAAGVPVRGFGTPDAHSLPVPCTSLVPYGDPSCLAIATCRVWEHPSPPSSYANSPGAMAAVVAGVYDSLVR